MRSGPGGATLPSTHGASPPPKIMRFLPCALLAVAASAGCGESTVPTIPPDAGRDASIDPDGGIDVPDGSDGDAGTDGGIPDGGGSWCNTSSLCPSCPERDALCDSDNPCPVGEICLLTGCDDLSRCFVTGGGACQEDDDCADPAYFCNQTIGRCLRISPGCEDSNDCVAGFACENDTCVDRRVPCESGLDCPHGYTCFFASPDQRFCRRIGRPCVDDIDCLVLGVPCGDADADGLKECMPSLMPNASEPVSCGNTQCPEAATPVCETTVEGTGAVCGRFGPCNSPTDCAAGFECRDLWGDSRSECVLPGGSCVDSSECAIRTVCASPRTDGPPICVGGTAI